ncbi:MAG: periplasmic heavy metal sensor [Alphaproteobacteria bacterium]|nr:periplasmic heavy metal sensor [Alphaproteobacteria bacterium]
MAGQTQTSGDQTPVRPTRSGRGLRWALGISLALNLAVVGMVAGAMLRDGPGMRGAMVRDLGFGPFTEALSREDRRALRQALFERAPEIRQARQQRQEDLQALVAILRAEPFDAAALAAAMAEQEARMVGQLRLGQTILQERIAAMTPEARRGFAERLEDGLSHAGRRSQKD